MKRTEKTTKSGNPFMKRAKTNPFMQTKKEDKAAPARAAKAQYREDRLKAEAREKSDRIRSIKREIPKLEKRYTSLLKTTTGKTGKMTEKEEQKWEELRTVGNRLRGSYATVRTAENAQVL